MLVSEIIFISLLIGKYICSYLENCVQIAFKIRKRISKYSLPAYLSDILLWVNIVKIFL